MGRSNQALGASVCHYGISTGYTCGFIISKKYAPSYVNNPNPTFIRVHNYDNVDLSQGGDSGGPWYSGQAAWGIHSGHPGSDDYDALYMAINYISSLGVSVRTAG